MSTGLIIVIVIAAVIVVGLALVEVGLGRRSLRPLLGQLSLGPGLLGLLAMVGRVVVHRLGLDPADLPVAIATGGGCEQKADDDDGGDDDDNDQSC